MFYPDYLRTRAGECLRLVVQDPWDKGAAELIDLAQDYRAWATDVERAENEQAEAGTAPETVMKRLIRRFH